LKTLELETIPRVELDQHQEIGGNPEVRKPARSMP